MGVLPKILCQQINRFVFMWIMVGKELGVGICHFHSGLCPGMNCNRVSLFEISERAFATQVKRYKEALVNSQVQKH